MNDAHEGLEELMFLHQECLMVGAFEVARDVLCEYRRLIVVHMEHEEGVVLPVYARAKTTRWPAEMFTGQHKKIRALLDRIEQAWPDWTRRPGGADA